jgi:FAD/FMN-containing dehydrogenase
VHAGWMEGSEVGPLTRRSILRGAAAVAVGLAAPGAGWWAPTSAAGLQPEVKPGAKDWRKLAGELRGVLLRPDAPLYRAAVRTFDPRRDGATPLAVVQVAGAADVVRTLAFAQRFELPVRPRCGGHSYVGASTGNGVLVVDTGALRTVRLDPSARSVRIGAGARLGPVHLALDRHGRTVPTGTCPTVGAAGLILGGGIGAETRLHGLTADAVLEIRIVTPDGRVRKVDAQDEPDLFWALRGGGGGNFGVVTELVLRTFRSRPAEFFFLRWSAAHAVDVLRGWQERVGHMPRSSWANVHLDATQGTVVPRIVGVAWGASGRAEARALIRAVGVQPVGELHTSRSHSGAMQLLAGPAGTQRQSWVAGSDIISAPLSRAEATAVVAVVRHRGAARRPGTLIVDPIDGAVHDGSTREASFPWRHALASLQWYVGIPSRPARGVVRSGRDFIRSGHTAVASASAGGYVNYVEPSRPLRQYYGSSWTKLVETNEKYDPDGFFSSAFSLPG